MARRRDYGQNVRHGVHGRHNNLFSSSWYSRHSHFRYGRCHWGHARPGYWWRRATWATVAVWFPWRWSNAIYYDYGGNVYYSDNSVYVDGTEACSAEDYALQATAIATSAPPVEETADQTQQEVEGEWMPLGVFTLVNEDQSDPHMFLQLAVSKQGVIAGTYSNTITDAAEAVEGMVDEKSQRAAWTIGDNKEIVLETGIYNLTEDQTTVLVHFGTEKTQEWGMVRLDEPEADAAQQN